MARKKRKVRNRRPKWLKILYVSLLIILVTGSLKIIDLYRKVMRANVVLEQRDDDYFFIPTDSDYEDVAELLQREGLVRNVNSFRWVAEMKNYPQHVNPGRYKIKNGMSNNELVNLLRSGEQEPVRVRFQNIRTLAELAGKVASNIEADSIEILHLLTEKEFISKYGFTEKEVIGMFIPNTYEFYWNTSAEDFFKRMATEYKKFWAGGRLDKARMLNLSQNEVSTLASIVNAEQTIRPDERAKVAGLYINRLKRGMRLESDPTIIYAKGDFTIKRVLNEDRKINSPYNTYQHRGLPPGPINIPDISSIDAVLNYEKHDYIFMCAKEDFSGYHNFSKTNAQHNIYAQRYRNELNKRKIYR